MCSCLLNCAHVLFRSQNANELDRAGRLNKHDASKVKETAAAMIRRHSCPNHFFMRGDFERLRLFQLTALTSRCGLANLIIFRSQCALSTLHYTLHYNHITYPDTDCILITGVNGVQNIDILWGPWLFHSRLDETLAGCWKVLLCINQCVRLVNDIIIFTSTCSAELLQPIMSFTLFSKTIEGSCNVFNGVKLASVSENTSRQ